MNNHTISYPADAHFLTRKIEDTSFWYQHRNEVILTAVKNNISADSVIYDLGGGNGVVAKAISDSGYKCVLVEALPDAILIAKKRNIESVIQQTIQDFNESSLSAVLLLDVLEHIEKDEETLLKIFTQLEAGGTLIITVPAFTHLTTDIDKEIGHYRRYTKTQLSDLLIKCGYKVSYSTYFFSLLYFPFYVFRVIPDRLGFKKANKQNRRDSEHLAGNSWLNKILFRLLHWESSFIEKKRDIPVGTSCLIIAKK